LPMFKLSFKYNAVLTVQFTIQRTESVHPVSTERVIYNLPDASPPKKAFKLGRDRHFGMTHQNTEIFKAALRWTYWGLSSPNVQENKQ